MSLPNRSYLPGTLSLSQGYIRPTNIGANAFFVVYVQYIFWMRHVGLTLKLGSKKKGSNFTFVITLVNFTEPSAIITLIAYIFWQIITHYMQQAELIGANNKILCLIMNIPFRLIPLHDRKLTLKKWFFISTQKSAFFRHPSLFREKGKSQWVCNIKEICFICF